MGSVGVSPIFFRNAFSAFSLSALRDIGKPEAGCQTGRPPALQPDIVGTAVVQGQHTVLRERTGRRPGILPVAPSFIWCVDEHVVDQ